MTVFVISHSDYDGEWSTCNVMATEESAVAWIKRHCKITEIFRNVYYYEDEPSYYRTYYQIDEWNVEE